MLVQTALLNNKRGLTLVEVLIAMVVLLLVSLAMMQTALVSIDFNMRNTLRDEAVNFAEMRMGVLRNTQFDDPLLNQTVNAADAATASEFRNTQVNFTSRKTITNMGTDNKEIDITVTWEWKENTVANGNPYTHRISTIMRRK